MASDFKPAELLPVLIDLDNRIVQVVHVLLAGRRCIDLAEFCLRAQVYYLLIRSAMGVQGATLVSMRSAYDNGKESAAELETAINRLRQTQVTASVIETSSGLWPKGEE